MAIVVPEVIPESTVSSDALRTRLSILSSMLAGTSPPLPAYAMLRRDVAAAQNWLDQSHAELDALAPSGRPPDKQTENRGGAIIKVSL